MPDLKAVSGESNPRHSCYRRSEKGQLKFRRNGLRSASKLRAENGRGWTEKLEVQTKESRLKRDVAEAAIVM